VRNIEDGGEGTAAATVTQPRLATVAIEMVTARMAAEWLVHNTGNRRVQIKNVSRFARDMVEGRWGTSTDAIGFDTNGRLINGQNRLHAVLLASESNPDIAVPMMVARSMPPESFQLIDQGTIRTIGQVLSVSGMPHYTVVATVARQIIYYDLYPDVVWRPFETISRVEVTQFAIEHREAILEARPWKPHPKFPRTMNVSTWAVLRYLVQRDSDHEGRWDEFERAITHGENLGPTDARLVLRNSQLVATWGVSGMQPRLGAYIKAWNYWIEERPTAQLLFRRNELPMPRVR